MSNKPKPRKSKKPAKQPAPRVPHDRTSPLRVALIPGLDQLKRRASVAERAAILRLESLVASGDMRKQLWRFELNPLRHDRPRPEEGKSKQIREAEKLVETSTATADRLRETAIMIRRAREEADRAAGAVLTNLTMLNNALTEVKRGVHQAREAHRMFRVARRREAEFNEQTTEVAHPAPVAEGEPGVSKKKEVRTMAKNEVTIPELLRQLNSTDDQVEKRKLRAKLRARGHTGGTGGKRTAKKVTKKTAKKVTKKVTRQAA